MRELRDHGYKTDDKLQSGNSKHRLQEVDRLYFDEISFESVMDVYGSKTVRSYLSMGGQIAII